MTPSSGGAPQGSLQLRDYLSLLRLHKWSVLLVVVATILAAVYYTSLQSATYRSSARVLVQPASIVSTSGAQVLDRDWVNLDTEIELATSEEVAEIAAGILKEERANPRALLGGLFVERVPNTEILLFSYMNPDPTVPRQRAQVFVDAYLEFRRQQVETDLASATQSLEERIEQVRSQLNSAQAELARLDENSFNRPTLQARADSLVQQIANLEQQLRELTDPDALRVGQVVERAGMPGAVLPDVRRNAILGLLVGLVLAIAITLLRDRLDDRVRNRQDVEWHAQTPVLSTVPPARRPWRHRNEVWPVIRSDPESPTAEAYRTLATSVIYASKQRGLRSVVVTSPNPGDGKSTTAANLGIALAATGHTVVLVSADLRKPRLHEFFRAHNHVGLANVLREDRRLVDAIALTGMQNLRLLPSGPIPPRSSNGFDPVRLLSLQAMGETLAHLSETAEFVVVDSPPILPVADGLILGPLADGVLVVADAYNTSRSSLAETQRRLDQVRARTVGAVLNRARAEHGYGTYRYGYPTDNIVHDIPVPVVESAREDGRGGS